MRRLPASKAQQPAMPPHNLQAHRQSKPRPALAFGREERLKYLLADVRMNARARIRDREAHPIFPRIPIPAAPAPQKQPPARTLH